MSWLIDTNILVRICDTTSPDSPIATQALDQLFSEQTVYSCTQTLIEFWVVATRPLEANGLGFAPQAAMNRLEGFQAVLPCLPEPDGIVENWKSLVAQYSITSRKAYDARLAALMVAHNIERILTFNLADFSKFQNIRAISPKQLTEGAP